MKWGIKGRELEEKAMEEDVLSRKNERKKTPNKKGKNEPLKLSKRMFPTLLQVKMLTLRLQQHFLQLLQRK